MRRALFVLVLISTLCDCQRTDMSQLRETIYVRNGGADMPAYVYGNGASSVFVILLHGGPGGSGLEYRFGTWYRELEDKYAMVYWDQRGQGASQGQYESDQITLNQMVDDLSALLKTLRKHYGIGIEFVLLGHSWGGMLGTAFMTDSLRQQQVSGWIEASGAHDFPMLEKEAAKMFRQIAKEMITGGNSVEYWTDILTWVEGIDTNEITRQQSLELNKKAFDVEKTLQKDGFISYGEFYLPTLIGRTNKLSSMVSGRITNLMLAEELDTTALTPLLGNIYKPSLVIYGVYDFVTPPSLGISAHSRISSTDKTLVLLQQSGHTLMGSEPQEFASELIQFIDRVTGN